MLLLVLALLAAAPVATPAHLAKGAKPIPAATAAPALAPAAADAPTFVLLNRATWLRLAPSDDAPKVRDPRVDRGRLSLGPLLEEDFWVLRFVEKDVKGWVTVETVPGLVDYPNREQLANGTHCYPGAEVSWLALRFYVRAEELQTVLTRTVSHDGKDGTGFTLRPGVAVGRPMDERIPVFVDGLRFTAKIPADAVATTYQPTREPFYGPKKKAGARIVPKATVTLDGAAVDMKRALVTLVPSSSKPLAGGASLVEMEWNCGSYRLKVVTPEGTPAVEERGGLMGGLGTMAGDAGAKRPVVKAGAKAWWRNGSAAGHAVEELEPGMELAKAGERRCFGFSLRKVPIGLARTEKDPLEVCFDVKDVTEPR